MTCYIRDGRITCYRGVPKENISRSTVEDRQGNTWYVSVSKEEFYMKPIIEVFDIERKNIKKFKREFLTWRGLL